MQFNIYPFALLPAVIFGFLSGMLKLENSGLDLVGDATPWYSPRVATTRPMQPMQEKFFAYRGQFPPSRSSDYFFTPYDENGELLQSNCNYELTWQAPPASFWSLQTTTSDYRLTPDLLNSQTAVLEADNLLRAHVSHQASFGNRIALPKNPSATFQLVLIVHEPEITRFAARTSLPNIVKKSCSDE